MFLTLKVYTFPALNFFPIVFQKVSATFRSQQSFSFKEHCLITIVSILLRDNYEEVLSTLRLGASFILTGVDTDTTSCQTIWISNPRMSSTLLWNSLFCEGHWQITVVLLIECFARTASCDRNTWEIQSVLDICSSLSLPASPTSLNLFYIPDGQIIELTSFFVWSCFDVWEFHYCRDTEKRHMSHLVWNSDVNRKSIIWPWYWRGGSIDQISLSFTCQGKVTVFKYSNVWRMYQTYLVRLLLRICYNPRHLENVRYPGKHARWNRKKSHLVTLLRRHRLWDTICQSEIWNISINTCVDNSIWPISLCDLLLHWTSRFLLYRFDTSGSWPTRARRRRYVIVVKSALLTGYMESLTFCLNQENHTRELEMRNTSFPSPTADNNSFAAAWISVIFDSWSRNRPCWYVIQDKNLCRSRDDIIRSVTEIHAISWWARLEDLRHDWLKHYKYCDVVLTTMETDITC